MEAHGDIELSGAHAALPRDDEGNRAAAGAGFGRRHFVLDEVIPLHVYKARSG